MLDSLPSINACLNASSCALLVLGFFAIRSRRKTLHMRLMIAALTCSGLFLVGYLTRMALTGTHRFPGAGPLKIFYLTLLISHMILAVVILPMIARLLFLAARARFAEHRSLARITWPLWLYVSVTGVVVYAMLYHVAPALT